jgi:uncharacterized protein YsxB (DUF464 family)
MVEITYYEYKRRLAIKATGHACYAEPGRDIVCAGVSVLLQSLGMYLESIENKSFKILENKQEPGDINVEVLVEDPENVVIQNLFYLTISGLEAISNSYPAYVKINGLKNYAL